MVIIFSTTVVAPPLYGFAEEKTTERTIEESNYTLVVENYNDDFSVELKKDSSFDLEKRYKLLIRFLHLLADEAHTQYFCVIVQAAVIW